jgi:VanZ family protein
MNMQPSTHVRSRADVLSSPTLSLSWLPALMGLLVISIESTRMMGTANTSQWLLALCSQLWGQTDTASFEAVHAVLRKCGHFTGYGMLGLLFAKGWSATLARTTKLRRRVRRGVSVAAGVLSAAAVASLDELHQTSLPGRTGTFHDVVLDSCGALLFGILLWKLLGLRKSTLLQRWLA